MYTIQGSKIFREEKSTELDKKSLPVILTNKRINKLVSARNAGASLSIAAMYANISKSTLRQWISDGFITI